MPELPEVETIRSNLRRGGPESVSLLGKTITNAQLFWERTLATPSPAEFRTRVTGQVIREIGRRGKYLILKLTKDYLLIHLRMSGDLLVEPENAPIAAHHRLVLELSDGIRLAFSDPRKFGRAWLVDDPEIIVGTLGPEPFDPSFTPEMLYNRLQDHRRQLKPLLLDQTFLAGLGNIYTDEALHLAGLHPQRLSNQVTRQESERLLQSIRRVLEEGIRRSGASIDWVYRGGDFQNYLRVYRRSGEPCPVCGTPVERIVIGQRSTHYCPSCQPPSPP